MRVRRKKKNSRGAVFPDERLAREGQAGASKNESVSPRMAIKHFLIEVILVSLRYLNQSVTPDNRAQLLFLG